MLPPTIAIGWTTLPTRDQAESLGHTLVERQLAACAQVSGPVLSIYSWEGKIDREEEFRLTLKFATARQADLQAALIAAHPYDTPQWVVVHADHTLAAYAEWVTGTPGEAP